MSTFLLQVLIVEGVATKTEVKLPVKQNLSQRRRTKPNYLSETIC